MKNLRNLLATITLTAVLMISATTANAGIIMSDAKGDQPQPCTETKNAPRVDKGILMSDFTGILVTGFTGILVTGFTGILVTGYSQVDCGIIMSD